MSEGVPDTALLARRAGWLDRVEVAAGVVLMVGLVAHLGFRHDPLVAYGVAAGLGVLTVVPDLLWRRWRPLEVEPAAADPGSVRDDLHLRWWERALTVPPGLVLGIALLACLRHRAFLVAIFIGTATAPDDRSWSRAAVAVGTAVVLFTVLFVVLERLHVRWGLDDVTIRRPRWRRARAGAQDPEPA